VNNKADKAASLARNVSHELWQFAIIAGYLYVCLGALILFKTAILRGEGISYAPFGVAAVKALVLGKFILLVHAVGLGDRFKKRKPITLSPVNPWCSWRCC